MERIRVIPDERKVQRREPALMTFAVHCESRHHGTTLAIFCKADFRFPARRCVFALVAPDSGPPFDRGAGSPGPASSFLRVLCAIQPVVMSVSAPPFRLANQTVVKSVAALCRQ